MTQSWFYPDISLRSTHRDLSELKLLACVVGHVDVVAENAHLTQPSCPRPGINTSQGYSQ